MKNHTSGNSLIEYGVIGSLILVGALVVLIGMGGQLNDWLAGLKGDLEAKKTAVANESSRRANQGTFQPSATGRSFVDAQGRACFSGGQCLNIPVYDAARATAMTAGGLGGDVTHEFASVIEQIAAQLQAENADPTLVDLISELANAGHALGNREEAMWDGMNVECVFPDPTGTCVVSDVYDRTTSHFNRMALEQQVFQARWDSLNAYLAAHPDALATFPEAKGIIDTEARQIHVLADSIKQAVKPVHLGGSHDQTSYYPEQLGQGLTPQDASTFTHQSSNEICDQGGQNCHQATEPTPSAPVSE